MRPQVLGDSSVCADIDGCRVGPGIRGAKNLRVGSYRQTTTASNIKDAEMLNILTYNVKMLVSDERLIELENALKCLLSGT